MTKEEPQAADGTPVCPKCGSVMKLRTARRGSNAGGQFWGCSTFPECRGIVAIDKPDDGDADTPHTPEASDHPMGTGAITTAPQSLSKRVSWDDATLRRPGWICRYGSAGSSLRSIPGSIESLAPLSNCWIARSDDGEFPRDPSSRRFVEIVRKLLERGKSPPLDPEAERAVLELAGLAEDIIEPTNESLTFRLGRKVDLEPWFGFASWEGADPMFDSDVIALDSEEESRFTDWAAENLSRTSARSLIPQAPLESLARGLGLGVTGTGVARQVDFLLAEPVKPPLIVEIDGEQHKDTESLNRDRDQMAKAIGVDTVRIPAEEVRIGKGANLAEVEKRCTTSPGRSPDGTELLLALGPAAIHRFVRGLLEAVGAGFIGGARWVIEVCDPVDIVGSAIRPYFDLMLAIDRMWETEQMPEHLELRCGDQSLAWARGTSGYEPVECDTGYPVDVRITLEFDRSPVEPLPPMRPYPEVLIRSSTLPVEPSDPIMGDTKRVAAPADSEVLVNSLRVVLRSIFALADFRDGQLDALVEIMQGRPCAVLLPTGAGKSLIYQLAGLCLPGRTIVVDPIISLMEDQVRGLAANGIDRVVAISMYSAKAAGGRGAINDLVASGEAFFTFLSPERLQQREFRNALRTLATSNVVNIAVVDEAHCVSEWGHDFRTSYLNLGRVLRVNSRSADLEDQGPPVLALTGTASRAVLRDLLIELEIERDGERTVVQPSSFDRGELHYSIHIEEPAQAPQVLAGLVANLPGKFNLPEPTFFSSRGRKTMSGIVFCPHKTGQFGVVDVARELEARLTIEVPYYSGTAPRSFRGDWEAAKRNNAEAFKANRAPLLVSTKAFGMGIDKPNVRYVVHLGIPGSIESYYQEVGRAGRDRQRAECVLLMTEYDHESNRELLDEDRNLGTIRKANKERKRGARDDVSNQLFFLLNSFEGEEVEQAAVEGLIREFGDSLGSPDTLSLAMPGGDTERKRVEKGLHRLVILGVLRDYMVNHGSREFEAELTRCDQRSVAESLLAYVRRSQPGRAQQIEEQIGDLSARNLSDGVLSCSRALIGFIYDTVERSRRRSLREMWLATYEGRGDPDGLFRERILEYLTQGAISPELEKLLERETVSFTDWSELLDEIEMRLPIEPDAGAELRGSAARLLASSPDHPGLLLARGVSELLVGGSDLNELVSSLRAARASGERYGISEEQIAQVAGWTTRFARNSKLEGAMTAVALGFDHLAPEHLGLGDDDFSCEPDLAVLALSATLDNVNQELEAILAGATSE
jgi:ATP-dependent DNA helicase RecQ